MAVLYDETFADTIARVTFERFEKLPKRGKPQRNKEWTLLSSIVMSYTSYSSNKIKFKVIALATGTKCMGRSSLSKNGDIVADSHAEVLTRRAFIRYLFHQVSLVLRGEKSEIFKSSMASICVLKPDVKFHFFISHTPCGDASIFPMLPSTERKVSSDIIIESKTVKRMTEDDMNENSKKVKLKKDTQQEIFDNFELPTCNNCQDVDIAETEDVKTAEMNSKVSDDIFRTGAKCVATGAQDPKDVGVSYHVVGALRTKPGRGDPTCSMSCSDKMAMWNICGLQGALASHFLSNPIYWSSIVIGKCPFDQSALQRAIVNRTLTVSALPQNYSKSQPRIFQSRLEFDYSKENIEKICQKPVPCPAALIWSDIPKQGVDVCVNGKKQGIIKKDLEKPTSWVNICRRNLIAEFISVLSLTTENELPDALRYPLKQNGSYLNFKEAAVGYQEVKSAVFSVFNGWVKKPVGLQDFVANKQLK